MPRGKKAVQAELLPPEERSIAARPQEVGRSRAHHQIFRARTRYGRR